MARLLVVDDHDGVRVALARAFEMRKHVVWQAATGEEAVAIGRREKPHAAVVDLSLPALSGDGAFAALKTEQEDLIGVAISGVFPAPEGERRSHEAGFLSFLHKPLDVLALVDFVERALATNPSHRSGSPDAIESRAAAPLGMIGDSPAMRELHRLITRIAWTDTTVLIEGETGTGKDLVAHAIHDASKRSGGPFVAVNCPGVPRELLESELFGSNAGAFTGAVSRPGFFEQARAGTLFLDEIGDLSSSGQAVLLRILDHKVVQRLGGQRQIPLDVRVIAATNVDLEHAAKSGRFRPDLLYRLRESVIVVPPLRERGADLVLLADALLSRLCRTLAGGPKRLSADAYAALGAHTWPGNVRELQHALVQACQRADADTIDVAHLSLTGLHSPSFSFAVPPRPGGVGLSEATQRLREAAERHWIAEAVARAPTLSEAARELEINVKTLYDKMTTYGIKVPGRHP